MAASLAGSACFGYSKFCCCSRIASGDSEHKMSVVVARRYRVLATAQTDPTGTERESYRPDNDDGVAAGRVRQQR